MRRFIGVAVCSFMVMVLAFPAMATDYTKLDKEVDDLDDYIWGIASNVWEFAELGYEEVKSSALESEALRSKGFTISDQGIAAASIPRGSRPGEAGRL